MTTTCSVNTIGTQVKRTQATATFELEVGNGFTFWRSLARYNDMDTVRNGVFPNTLQSASSFLTQQNNYMAKAIPVLRPCSFRYVSGGAVYDTLNQNGNGLMIVGGLRGVTSPVREFINDARLMRKFEFGSQTHDATIGYYVANVSNDFSRYSSSALLDVQNNARLLDLVAVDASGQRRRHGHGSRHLSLRL